MAHMGVSQNSGTHVGGPHNQDYIDLLSISGYLYFEKLSLAFQRTVVSFKVPCWLEGTLNLKPLNPKPLNPKPLNPKPLNFKP